MMRIVSCILLASVCIAQDVTHNSETEDKTFIHIPKCDKTIVMDTCEYESSTDCKLILPCGWGNQIEMWKCPNADGEPVQKKCRSTCYKLCPGDHLPECPDVFPTHCKVIKKEDRCTKQVGLGYIVVMYVNEHYKLEKCKQKCCCKRAGGAPGPGPAPCTPELMATSEEKGLCLD